MQTDFDFSSYKQTANFASKEELYNKGTIFEILGCTPITGQFGDGWQLEIFYDGTEYLLSFTGSKEKNLMFGDLQRHLKTAKSAPSAKILMQGKAYKLGNASTPTPTKNVNESPF